MTGFIYINAFILNVDEYFEYIINIDNISSISKVSKTRVTGPGVTEEVYFIVYNLVHSEKLNTHGSCYDISKLHEEFKSEEEMNERFKKLIAILTL